MSGGVDSSVAAYLMKENGYSCVGVTMKLYENEDAGIAREKTCCSLSDIEDAKQVAHLLEIPYYVVNFTAKFKKEIMERFVCAYEEGRTPNPCIDCNRYIKFDALFQRAKELNLDYIVTGHYARIMKDEDSGRYLLLKSVDETKDQSYVLYNMTQEELAHTKFPLGQLKKTSVRDLAKEQGFINAKKHDSQDICFVPDGDYVAFMERYRGQTYKEGNFLNLQGEVIGRHKGMVHYTIGQRKGLGISGKEPMYVCQKSVKENTVTLGRKNDLMSRDVFAKEVNLISCEKINSPIKIQAKIRYSQEPQWATATQLDETHLKIVFDDPQRAVTAGQAVVLYDGEIVVGGGIIQ